MDRAEFNRIKEAEKTHLRKLKALKEAAGRLERQKKIAQALGNMSQEAQEKLEANESSVEELAWETARQEARLEIALENAREGEATSEQGTPTSAPDPAQADEELQRARAEELVRQIKSGLEAEATPPDVRSPSKPDRTAPDVRPKDNARDALPEKTIGRRPPS